MEIWAYAQRSHWIKKQVTTTQGAGGAWPCPPLDGGGSLPLLFRHSPCLPLSSLLKQPDARLYNPCLHCLQLVAVQLSSGKPSCPPSLLPRGGNQLNGDVHSHAEAGPEF